MANTKIPDEIGSFGDAIRYLRERRSMTLRQLAREVKVSAPFLSDLEHDRRRTHKLPEFAKALGVALEDLRRFDGRLPPDVKDWIRATPGMVELLQDIRRSKKPPEELRAAIRRRR